MNEPKRSTRIVREIAGCEIRIRARTKAFRVTTVFLVLLGAAASRSMQ